MAADDALERVAASVADGSAIDWDAALASASTDEERAAIRALKEAAGIARTIERSTPAGQPATEPRSQDAGASSARSGVAAVGTWWGHLHLREWIGTGTYGDVYRAWDSRLDREVALKLLHRNLAAPSDSIIAEGRLLAMVRHPNVVSVFGADCLDARTGIWMELIDGRTLAGIIHEQGPLGASEAAVMGLDLCRALAAVHGAGLLHRDVKAQNVMREAGGRILLMDFGAGREGTAPSGREMAGTPAYLAPEILRGEPASARSDVYSLGVLLYFLVTGTYPVTSTTAPGLVQAHANGERRLLFDARPDLPGEFVRVVNRATAAKPSDRYETAGALQSDLAGTLRLSPASPAGASMTSARLGGTQMRRAPGVTAIALAIISMLAVSSIGVWWRFAAPSPVMPFEARDWVLVTAFENRTGQKAFDGTIEYALQHDLAHSPFVNVVPRERADDALRLMRRPPGQPLDAALGREVCLRDGAIRALITGRLERSGAGYLLSADIVDPRDGQSVGAATEEAQAQGDVVRAAQRLALRVRAMLGERRDQIRAAEDEIEKVTTPSWEAWKLHSEAVRAGSLGNWLESAHLARTAVELDPGFASAHAWLARSLVFNLQIDEGMREIQRAEQLAPTAAGRERLYIVALSHYLRASVLSRQTNLAIRRGVAPPADGRIRQERDEAASAYEALLRVYPDEYWAASDLAFLYDAMARREESLRMMVRMARLRPTSFTANYNAAFRLVSDDGSLGEAAPFLDRARALLPPDATAAQVSWLKYEAVFEEWAKGDPSAALARLVELQQGQDERFAADAAPFYLALGRLSAAERSLEPVRPRGVPPETPEAGQHADVFTQVIIACHRDDVPSARDIAREFPSPATPAPRPPPPANAWLYVRLGLVSDAERVVRAFEILRVPDSPGLAWARGEVALARGDVNEAVPLLRRAVRQLVRFYSIMAAESLADALERSGQRGEACEVLEEATHDRAKFYYGPGTMLSWVRARGHLVELCRRNGRAAEAEALAADLRNLLRYADRDFVVTLRTPGIASALPLHLSPAGPPTL